MPARRCRAVALSLLLLLLCFAISHITMRRLPPLRCAHHTHYFPMLPPLRDADCRYAAFITLLPYSHAEFSAAIDFDVMPYCCFFAILMLLEITPLFSPLIDFSPLLRFR